MAMHCQEASERISQAMDRILPPQEQEELEEHLKGCVPCRERYRALTAVASLLEVTHLAEPPPEMAARVMDRIHTQRRRHTALVAWARRAVWAVMIIAVAALLVSAISSAHETLVSTQSVYASLLHNLVILYQVGISIARGLRVIVRAFLGHIDVGHIALYASLALAVGLIWLRLVAHGALSPAHAERN